MILSETKINKYAKFVIHNNFIFGLPVTEVSLFLADRNKLTTKRGNYL
jgi:hypothetical protein